MASVSIGSSCGFFLVLQFFLIAWVVLVALELHLFPFVLFHHLYYQVFHWVFWWNLIFCKNPVEYHLCELESNCSLLVIYLECRSGSLPGSVSDSLCTTISVSSETNDLVAISKKVMIICINFFCTITLHFRDSFERDIFDNVLSPGVFS